MRKISKRVREEAARVCSMRSSDWAQRDRSWPMRDRGMSMYSDNDEALTLARTAFGAFDRQLRDRVGGGSVHVALRLESKMSRINSLIGLAGMVAITTELWFPSIAYAAVAAQAAFTVGLITGRHYCDERKVRRG